MEKRIKAQKREQKKPKMKVSGKSVFKIREIIGKKADRLKKKKFLGKFKSPQCGQEACGSL